MSQLNRMVLATVIESECVPENMTARNFRSFMESVGTDYIDASNIKEVGYFLDAIHCYCKARTDEGAMLTQADYQDILAHLEEAVV